MLRRLPPILLAFVLSGFILWLIRGQTGEYGLFRFLSGAPPPLATSAQAELAVDAPFSQEDLPQLNQLNLETIQLAERVRHSVVSITTSKAMLVRRYVRNPFGIIPQEEHMNESGLGSGVIVSSDGYIITNYHVIAQVDDILVTTHDHNSYPATVVGYDMDIDIAVLKINPVGNKILPLPFGNSDLTQVGEIVFSIGNPFGLSESLTQGIISARERRISDSSFDLLQTDAVINPGNSGGPLLNVHGEIIGIAMAIFQGQQDVKVWQGIGLAIPSNDARTSYEAILNNSRSSIGWIGISMEESIDPSTGRPEAGIRVSSVQSDSPAEKAGIKVGDRVIKFGGRDLKHSYELRNMVKNAKVGEPARLTINRGADILICEPLVAEKQRLLEATATADPKAPLVQAKSRSLEKILGINIRELLPAERRRAGLTNPYGLVVYEVDEKGAASGILRQGDIVISLNGQGIEDTEHLDELLKNLPEDKEAVIGIVRNGRIFPLRLMPAAADT